MSPMTSTSYNASVFGANTEECFTEILARRTHLLMLHGMPLSLPAAIGFIALGAGNRRSDWHVDRYDADAGGITRCPSCAVERLLHPESRLGAE